MRPLVERTERLQRLAVFDAAARLGSFTAAATELGSSQPVVTRQIRALERSLGFELFTRTSNRSALTPAGVLLAASIDHGFTTIESSLRELAEHASTFVLASPPGFAQQLIVPALDELHEILQRDGIGCDLRLWLYDRESELSSGDADVVIRVGHGDWQRTESVRLFGESTVPVATAALAERLGLHRDSRPADLVTAPLLHMDAAGRPWMSWADWFEHFGLALPAGRRVFLNTYPMVVQQALAGRGVALGWRGIVDQLLDDELLVQVGPDVTTSRGYYVAWNAGRSNPAIGAVVDWLTGSLTRATGV